MSLLSSVAAFGLRQVFGGPADAVVGFVQQRFTDHSQALPRALVRAGDRSWQALEVALTGDGWLDSLKSWWSDGDQAALEKLMPLVYVELHRLAKRYMGFGGGSQSFARHGRRVLCRATYSPL